MITRYVVPILLLAALTIIGCSEGDPNASNVVVRDSQGIRIVETVGDGAGLQDWQTSSEIDIGASPDASSHAQFGTIWGIEVGRDGSIFVLDGLAREIRKFNANGEFLGAFGGPGSGPSELARPTGLMLLSDSIIVVPDNQNQAVKIYDTEGRFLRAEGAPFRLAGIPSRWDAGPGDRALVQLQQFPGAAGTDNGDDLLLALSLDGQDLGVDTLATLPGEGGIRAGASGPMLSVHLPETVWDADREGAVIVASSHEYQLTMRDTAGRVRQIATVLAEPEPIRDGERQEIQDIIASQLGEQDQLPPEVRETIVATMKVGSHYPVLTTLRQGSDGTVWVQRSRAAGTPLDTTNVMDVSSRTWDMLSNDGRLIGRLTFPEDFSPVVFRENRVYGVRTSELGVESVQVLRLRRAGGMR